MPNREHETLLRRDHERAVREQKGVVIVIVICAGIVVLFSHFAPSDQTQFIQQATVDHGLLPFETSSFHLSASMLHKRSLQHPLF